MASRRVFLLHIDTENYAFEGEHPFGDSTSMEVARILQELADRVEAISVDATGRDESDPFVLHDANGAMVGKAHFAYEDV